MALGIPGRHAGDRDASRVASGRRSPAVAVAPRTPWRTLRACGLVWSRRSSCCPRPGRRRGRRGWTSSTWAMVSRSSSAPPPTRCSTTRAPPGAAMPTAASASSCPTCGRRGWRLDGLIVSHADDDHSGGAVSVAGAGTCLAASSLPRRRAPRPRARAPCVARQAHGSGTAWASRCCTRGHGARDRRKRKRLELRAERRGGRGRGPPRRRHRAAGRARVARALARACARRCWSCRTMGRARHPRPHSSMRCRRRSRSCPPAGATASASLRRKSQRVTARAARRSCARTSWERCAWSFPRRPARRSSSARVGQGRYWSERGGEAR